MSWSVSVPKGSKASYPERINYLEYMKWVPGRPNVLDNDHDPSSPFMTMPESVVECGGKVIEVRRGMKDDQFWPLKESRFYPATAPDGTVIEKGVLVDYELDYYGLAQQEYLDLVVINPSRGGPRYINVAHSSGWATNIGAAYDWFEWVEVDENDVPMIRREKRWWMVSNCDPRSRLEFEPGPWHDLRDYGEHYASFCNDRPFATPNMAVDGWCTSRPEEWRTVEWIDDYEYDALHDKMVLKPYVQVEKTDD